MRVTCVGARVPSLWAKGAPVCGFRDCMSAAFSCFQTGSIRGSAPFEGVGLRVSTVGESVASSPRACSPVQNVRLGDFVLWVCVRVVLAGLVRALGVGSFPSSFARRWLRPSPGVSWATWLILPVVICLSQRLSHACLSISDYTVKLRMAH